MKLNLEVGKTYINRLGDKVTIIGEVKDSSWKFEGAAPNGIQSFTKRGCYLNACSYSEYDLVSEHKEVK